jgi:hypothetical protein
MFLCTYNSNERSEIFKLKYKTPKSKVQIEVVENSIPILAD